MRNNKWIWAGLLTLLGPGAGHIFLKMKTRGLVWLGVAGGLVLVTLGHIFIRLRDYLAVAKVNQTNDLSVALAESTRLSNEFMSHSSELILFYMVLLALVFGLCYLDLAWLWFQEKRSGQPKI